MEKRIQFFHFQSVKAVAKAIDPHLKSMESLKKKALALKEDYDERFAKLRAEVDEKAAKIKAEYDKEKLQINALEAGILQVTGFHVADLVKKVIEPTGKTDTKTGKPLKVTKYIPTDIVTYDETTKEFIVKTADEESEDTTQEEIVPPTTEEAGSDFDKDAESFRTSDDGVQDSGSDEQVQDEQGGTDEVADEVQESVNQMPWE